MRVREALPARASSCALTCEVMAPLLMASEVAFCSSCFVAVLAPCATTAHLVRVRVRGLGLGLGLG